MPSSLTNGRLWRRVPQRVPSDRKLILAGSRTEGMLACAFRPGRAPRFATLPIALLRCWPMQAAIEMHVDKPETTATLSLPFEDVKTSDRSSAPVGHMDVPI